MEAQTYFEQTLVSIILLKGCHCPQRFFMKYKCFYKSSRTVRKDASCSSRKNLKSHLQTDGSLLFLEYSQKCLAHHPMSVMIRGCPPSLQLYLWPHACWIQLRRTSLQFPEQFVVFPAFVSLSMLFLLPRVSFLPCPPGDPPPSSFKCHPSNVPSFSKPS